MTRIVRRFAPDCPCGKIHSTKPGTPCASLSPHEGHHDSWRVSASPLPTTQSAHAARTRGEEVASTLGLRWCRRRGERLGRTGPAGALSLHRGPSTTFSKRACGTSPSPFSSHTGTPQSDEIAGGRKSPCLWFFLTTSMLGLGPCVLRCASQLALPSGGGQKPGHRLPCPTHTQSLLRKWPSGGCNPHALQHSNDVSLAGPTVTTDARCQMSPEQARQCTLHSREATVLSIAQQVDVPEHQG